MPCHSIPCHDMPYRAVCSFLMPHQYFNICVGRTTRNKKVWKNMYKNYYKKWSTLWNLMTLVVICGISIMFTLHWKRDEERKKNSLNNSHTMTRKIPKTANLHIRLYFHLIRFTYLLFRQTRILCLILSAVKVIAKRVVNVLQKCWVLSTALFFFMFGFVDFIFIFFMFLKIVPFLVGAIWVALEGFFSFKSFGMHSVCKNSIFIEHCCFFIGYFFCFCFCFIE